jgi:hypothetical protein
VKYELRSILVERSLKGEKQRHNELNLEDVEQKGGEGFAARRVLLQAENEAHEDVFSDSKIVIFKYSVD